MSARAVCHLLLFCFPVNFSIVPTVVGPLPTILTPNLLSPGGRQKQSSDAAVKKKWQALEKSITQLALNKQTVASMEREMER